MVIEETGFIYKDSYHVGRGEDVRLIGTTNDGKISFAVGLITDEDKSFHQCFDKNGLIEENGRVTGHIVPHCMGNIHVFGAWRSGASSGL